MTDKTILIVGTYDTKEAELTYVAQCIQAMGGGMLTMDVSVLGDPNAACDMSKHDVAQAAGSSIQTAIDCGDENEAMQIMAAGASKLAMQAHASGRFDGVIVLGGTMGTDLALDVCQALPLGVPKYVVSTVSFSPLIPAERLAPDIQMILWAGGLYGLNSVCKSSLSQAAGAVLGAARAVEPPVAGRPVVGMTSLGSSCLRYMTFLKPALEARGFEVAIFHSTGMGGMAFEKIAAQGGFACVMDLCLQELSNLMVGSAIHAGADRMLNAGRAGIPQIIAPGCFDLIDYAGWQEIPAQYADRPFHAHNRLITSSGLTPDERVASARELAQRAQQSPAATHIVMPLQGVEEWDKAGGPAHDPEGLAAFTKALRAAVCAPVAYTEVDAHINDAAFADAVLAIFDAWLADGTLQT